MREDERCSRSAGAGDETELHGGAAAHAPRGTWIDRLYWIEAVIARDGGVLYRCRQKSPGKQLAIEISDGHLLPNRAELLLALKPVTGLGASSAAVDSRDCLPAATRDRAASHEPHALGSLPAVSGPQPVPSPRSTRWALQVLGAALVFSFSFSWLSYLQRSQPAALAGAPSDPASALPAPPDTAPSPPAPSPPPPVAPLVQTAPARFASELAAAPPRANAASARKSRTPRAAPEQTPPRAPKRLPGSPAPVRRAAAPMPDGLLRPWP